MAFKRSGVRSPLAPQNKQRLRASDFKITGFFYAHHGNKDALLILHGLKDAEDKNLSLYQPTRLGIREMGIYGKSSLINLLVKINVKLIYNIFTTSDFSLLFSAVSEVIGLHILVPIEYMAIEDRFGGSGQYE